jgi:hypothetical protein
MKTVARDATGALGFIAVGVVVAVGVAFVRGVEASPDPGYVFRGMDPYYGQTCHPWGTLSGYHPCWHDDEGSPDIVDYTAVDFDYGDPTGRLVSLSFSGYEYFRILEYTGTCKGVRVGIYSGHPAYGDYRGDLHYLHIDVLPNIIDTITTTLMPLGYVAWPDNPGCYTTGAHLHQSARITAETPFYTNKLADPVAGDNWIHAIMWEPGTSDQDGDEWNNEDELYIGTDPFDDCPDNLSDAAWPLDINNDRDIDVSGDVFNYVGRIGATAGGPNYWRRLDLDVSGDIDVTGDVSMYIGRIGESC